ncbi:hepatic lectin-like [Mobula birostris]|uniref:hepatic lectin-like n=1 Tax=Mobula birostris TaxID=1983395 RepID=UPI003B27B968
MLHLGQAEGSSLVVDDLVLEQVQAKKIVPLENMEAEATYQNIEDLLSSQSTGETLKPECRVQQLTNLRRKQSPRIVYTLVAISITLSVLALGIAVIRITKMASEFNFALNGFQTELSWWKHNVSENFEVNRNSVTALQAEISLLKENLPSCPEQWVQFKQNCYLFSSNTATWEKANESCASGNAHLMVINNVAEEEFLRKAVHDNTYWIGLTYYNRMLRWVDGTDYYFSIPSWNNRCYWSYSRCCVAISPYGGKEKLSCSFQHHSICEKPAE